MLLQRGESWSPMSSHYRKYRFEKNFPLSLSVIYTPYFHPNISFYQVLSIKFRASS